MTTAFLFTFHLARLKTYTAQVRHLKGRKLAAAVRARDAALSRAIAWASR